MQNYVKKENVKLKNSCCFKLIFNFNLEKKNATGHAMLKTIIV